jgi:hypothetical protein
MRGPAWARQCCYWGDAGQHGSAKVSGTGLSLLTCLCLVLGFGNGNGREGKTFRPHPGFHTRPVSLSRRPSLGEDKCAFAQRNGGADEGVSPVRRTAWLSCSLERMQPGTSPTEAHRCCGMHDNSALTRSASPPPRHTTPHHPPHLIQDSYVLHNQHRVKIRTRHLGTTSLPRYHIIPPWHIVT